MLRRVKTQALLSQDLSNKSISLTKESRSKRILTRARRSLRYYTGYWRKGTRRPCKTYWTIVKKDWHW
ncbi:hypothetical protein O3G_MSEX001075 [Manduca sexta]|nr:hypothetical protein O3G_MSEX001075 [Manduca sexta]